MSVLIKEVTTRRELREFVNFPERLYKDNPYYVPPLVIDQMDKNRISMIHIYRIPDDTSSEDKDKDKTKNKD